MGKNLMHSLEKNRGTEGLEGLGGEEGKWVGDRRDKKTGEEGRQEGKEQGRRGRRKGKENSLKMRRPHPFLVPQSSHTVPRKGSSQGGRGRGAVVPNPARSLVICCLMSSLLQTSPQAGHLHSVGKFKRHKS